MQTQKTVEDYRREFAESLDDLDSDIAATLATFPARLKRAMFIGASIGATFGVAVLFLP